MIVFLSLSYVRQDIGFHIFHLLTTIRSGQEFEKCKRPKEFDSRATGFEDIRKKGQPVLDDGTYRASSCVEVELVGNLLFTADF